MSNLQLQSKRNIGIITMEDLVKLEHQYQPLSSEFQQLNIDNSSIKIEWNSGQWSLQENAKCISYFQFNKTHLHSKLKMKENKFFKQMSIFIGSRSPIQCRSQCQKLLRKNKTFYNVILGFKSEYGFEKYEDEFKRHSLNPLIRFKGSLEMVSYQKLLQKCRDISIQTQKSYLLRRRLKQGRIKKINIQGQKNENQFPFMKAGWWL